MQYNVLCRDNSGGNIICYVGMIGNGIQLCYGGMIGDGILCVTKG